MATRTRVIFSVLLGIFFAFPAAAQDLFFYPSQGQTQDQLNLDKFECHTWAVQQTGFDPLSGQAAAPPPSAQPTQSVTASPVRGAAGGALGGLAIGAIAGDAKKGAAIGAVGGGLVGGMRRRDQQAQRQQQHFASLFAEARTQLRPSTQRHLMAYAAGAKAPTAERTVEPAGTSRRA